MEKQRYAESGENSFYGKYLYDQIVPAKHFLRMLNELIDWKRYTRQLIRLYKGEGVVGRPPFDPTLVLKTELIAFLYNLSERQVRKLASQVFCWPGGGAEGAGSFHPDGFSRAAAAARQTASF